MSRTARLGKGVGPLVLGGLLLSGVVARGADPPPLSQQLADLGRQALAQGETVHARTFFQKAVQLDPNNAEARRALGRLGVVRRVALQDPAAAPTTAPAIPEVTPPPGTPAADTIEAAAGVPAAPPAAPVERQAQATLENAQESENIQRQQLTNDVRQRIQAARDLINGGQPEAALNALRLAQTVVRSAETVDEATRNALDRELQANILSTVRAEERIVQERAEHLRLQASAEQRVRALDQLAKNQETVNTLMIQFDSLMAQGQYNVLANGGLGDIAATTAPFSDARLLAQSARALEPLAAAPRAGLFVAQTMGFLAQALAFEQIKEYRFMLTMQDVDRAAVPFPDTQTIEYPPIDTWRVLSERRIKRYGTAVDLLDRDAKTKSILAKLDEPISMAFPNETPLEDVLKYIRSATQGPNDTGIPIYVDPVGLNEAEKTMTSPVTLDLEGVPLKTTLRLLLKQLGLTYTVKDGLLTITSESSEDQPTEIRVYPVADLAIIPLSLMGNGMMGGMGRGLGGMGMGGMGGMGMGGMGGMGMGGMGGMGMMSVPVQEPDSAPGSAFLEKKSN
jgi:tetratricopeptide (TPR) repeat protein